MKTNYEAIKQANEAIKPMTMARQNKKTGEIVEKAYAEVNQRIKAFRMVHPSGCIDTSNFILEGELGKRIARFVAVIRDEGGQILATGTAEEKENSSTINATSFIENCETSAVGRALGMCGFGIDTSLASYEEVKNAVTQQEQEGKTEELRKQMFKQDAPKEETPKPKLNAKQVSWIVNHFQLKNASEITDEHVAEAKRIAEEQRNANK